MNILTAMEEPYDEDSMVEIPLNSDNEWTDERVKYCKRLANSRGAFVWLHSKSSRYYYIWNKALMVIVAVASGAFGAAITIADTIPDWPDSWKVVVAFACITVAAGAFGTILQALMLDTKSVNHSKASGKSTTLFMRISKEIQKASHMRVGAIKFIHSVMEEDSILRNQTSHIPGHVLRKYYRKFGKSAIEYNVLFGDDELLKIEEEINDSYSDEGREIEIVNQAMIRMTHGIHLKSRIKLRKPARDVSIAAMGEPQAACAVQEDTVESIEEMPEDLEELLKEHDKKVKFKRTPPDLSTQQLYDLEKYLNE
jgi:hypothetical protein